MPLRMGGGAAAQSVENYLDPAGNAELVKYSKQVIFYRVLGKFEALSDLSIGKTLGDAANDIDLAGGKRGAAIAAEIREGGLRQGVEQEAQLAAARPDLARVYAL